MSSKKSLRIFLTCIATAVSLTACDAIRWGGDTPEGTAPAGAKSVGATCSEEDPCVEWLQCEEGICVAMACEGDDDCGEGQVCKNDVCEKSCQSDDDCPAGFECKAEICAVEEAVEVSCEETFEIVSRAPDIDAGNVEPFLSEVAVTFNGTIDEDSLPDDALSVKKWNDEAMGGEVEVDNKELKFVFAENSPTALLAGYTVTLAEGLQDACGHALEEGDHQSWKFTTRDGVWLESRVTPATDHTIDGDKYRVYFESPDMAFDQANTGKLTITGNWAMAPYDTNEEERHETYVTGRLHATNDFEEPPIDNMNCQYLGEPGENPRSSNPRLVYDSGSEHSVMIWVKPDSDTGDFRSLWAAKLDEEGLPLSDTIEEISAPGHDVYANEVVIGPQGSLAIWVEMHGNDPDDRHIYARWFREGQWEDQATRLDADIPSDFERAFMPHVAIDPSTGDAIVVWTVMATGGDDGNDSISARIYTDNAWTAAENISHDDYVPATPPAMGPEAAAGGGNFAVAWTANESPGVYTVEYAVKSGDGAWDRKGAASGTSAYFPAPSLAVDHEGSILMVWNEFSIDGGTVNVRDYSAEGEPRGEALRLNVSDAPMNMTNPIVGVHRDTGHGLVLYSHRTETGGYVLKAVRYRAALEGTPIQREFIDLSDSPIRETEKIIGNWGYGVEVDPASGFALGMWLEDVSMMMGMVGPGPGRDAGASVFR